MNYHCRLFFVLLLIPTAAFLVDAQASRSAADPVVTSSAVHSEAETKIDISLDKKATINDPLVRV
ncbi:MAG TPA: hypothetical protein VIF64_19175, partial [Pyrinomonadaceae bacterium]